MSVRRSGVLASCVLGLVLVIGVVQASAAGPTQVLKFSNPPAKTAAVGFNPMSNAAPPVGASYVITLKLKNVGSQFGKPSGATVGRVLLDCVFLSVSPPNGDGICSGIAHVPDGYITFVGNGGFSNAPVSYYAITGGVGRYANDRGEIRATHGGATVTLTP